MAVWLFSSASCSSLSSSNLFGALFVVDSIMEVCCIIGSINPWRMPQKGQFHAPSFD